MYSLLDVQHFGIILGIVIMDRQIDLNDQIDTQHLAIYVHYMDARVQPLMLKQDVMYIVS